jgi:hypothetical protein
MNPKKITVEELEALENSGKEYYLLYDWEECVVRLGGQDGAHIKFKGEEEFIPHDKSNVFFEACRAGDQITKEEYDSY